ncbi:MAG: hypothetical protein HY569_00965 [Candidatus Magasanikbacteria bacterium]|nr:hypothetical protein [Candidatus Magasanikbacteria bacterium]
MNNGIFCAIIVLNMANMVYPDQNKNRTFLLTWEGGSLNNKKINLAVTDRIVATVEEIREEDKWRLIGSIYSKEELAEGKKFNFGDLNIMVQQKKVFWFIKELILFVDGKKVKGNSWKDFAIGFSQ